MVGRAYEAAGITKDGAKMIMVQSCSEVPKFTVIVNGSYGAGNFGHVRPGLRSALPLHVPQAQLSLMGAEQAANTLGRGQDRASVERSGEVPSEAEIAAIRRDVKAGLRAPGERLLLHLGNCGTTACSIRSTSSANGARHRHLVRPQRADRRAQVRRCWAGL